MKPGLNWVVLYPPLTAWHVITTFQIILRKELHKQMERQMKKQDKHGALLVPLQLKKYKAKGLGLSVCVLK